jgi:hypothetical protein
MAKSKKLVVNLKGPKPKRAPLPDFATVCHSLHATLKNVGRCIGGRAPDFAVSNLRMGSAVMEVEPAAAKDGEIEVMNLFSSTITALEEGQPIDHRLDYGALNCFRGFAGVARSENVTLTINRTRLTANYANNLSALLDPVSTALGSVSGRLEAITLHNQRVFTLFPPIPQEEIDCNFRPSDLARVLDAVTKQVTVYGTLHYAQSKIFPVRVDVEDFTIEESEAELPTLLEAKGLLPQLSTANPLLDGNFSDEWY